MKIKITKKQLLQEDYGKKVANTTWWELYCSGRASRKPPGNPPADLAVTCRTNRAAKGLKEDTELKNIALDVVGLVPGLGEFADLANAIDYAKKGDYLFAALSLISMVPAVGDLIGKGGKIGAWIAKSFPKGAAAVVKYGPEIRKLKTAVSSSKPMIDELFEKLKDNEKVGEYIPDIEEALNAFMGDEGEEDAESPEGEGGFSDIFGDDSHPEELAENWRFKKRVKQILSEELRAASKKHAKKPKSPLSILDAATKRLKRR
tara:strand:- start:314 stop:1096 length:783 start_codon:yes stop_codon:yes gene_type:complete